MNGLNRQCNGAIVQQDFATGFQGLIQTGIIDKQVRRRRPRLLDGTTGVQSDSRTGGQMDRFVARFIVLELAGPNFWTFGIQQNGPNILQFLGTGRLQGFL